MLLMGYSEELSFCISLIGLSEIQGWLGQVSFNFKMICKEW